MGNSSHVAAVIAAVVIAVIAMQASPKIGGLLLLILVFALVSRGLTKGTLERPNGRT